MCTLTWTPHEGGYAILFNRDELLTRKPGTQPAVHDLGGRRVLCPTDGDHGGTWIGINQHGVAVALLNGDPQAPRGKGPFRSRGLVALEALRQPTAKDAASVCELLDCSTVQPFTMFAIDLDLSPVVVEFESDGASMQDWPAPGLLASSSLVHADAKRARSDVLRNCLAAEPSPRISQLMAFHESHGPARGPLSPCMHRDDAHTTSATRIYATAGLARLEHHDGPPCQRKAWTRASLPLLAQGNG